MGLWKYSRHPNYVGEIIIWVGNTVFAIPLLQGWQFLTVISPIFMYVLLRWVSGVPLLEAKADKKWGNDPSYIEYKRNTPVLFPIGSGDEVVREEAAISEANAGSR